MKASDFILVRKSWELLRPKSGQFAELFFIRLFDKHPDLRLYIKSSLFSQQKLFIRVLEQIIDNSNSPDKLEGTYRKSRILVSFGVKPKHYPLVAVAFLEALSEALGQNWTPPVEKAWAEFVAEVQSAITHE